MRHSTKQHRMRERAVDPWPFALLVLFAVLALAVLYPRVASGVTLTLDAEQLAGMSHRVFPARVESVEVRPDAEHGIVTEVTVTRLGSFKGRPARSETLVLPGGRIGDAELFVSDVPHFSVGERVVLFVDRDGRPLGGTQGAKRIVSGRVADTGESLAALESRITGAPLAETGRESVGSALGLGSGLADDGAAATDSATLPPANASGTVADSGVTAQAVPSVSAISPSSAPAGIGAVVKIMGAGFGTRGAASAVEFTYRGSTPIVARDGQIKSWSDTQIEVEVPTGPVSGYPASAGTGPLTVVTGSGVRSAGHEFTVTFGYGGADWTGDPTQSFYIYENTADMSGEGSLVRAAAQTWSAQSSFSLTYAGTASSPVSGNDRNEIWWANSGPTGTLAEARYWMYYAPSDPDRPTRDYVITEADITFNDYYYWGTGSTSGSFDVQSVALHELGHWLSLRDLYGNGDSGKVMYGSIASGRQKRTPHAHDVAGVQWIYDDIDVTPPVTTVSGVPASWTDGPVTVTLSTTDDDGSATTYYRIGAGLIQTYSAPFTINAEGQTGVRYWAIDAAGNTETARTATVRIDRTPPTTSITGASTGYTRLTLGFDGSDPLSGISRTYYTIDGGAPVAGTSVTLSQPGTYTVQAWSVDTVGNVETPAAATTVQVFETPDIALDRVFGANRYATAVSISASTFATGTVDTAVLATGRQFADALSASGLAGAYGGPLLLTKSSDVPSDVMDELSRLGVSSVVIVGGETAVGEAVAEELSTAGYDVDRIEGRTRYETAAAVARRIDEVAGAPQGVFVARGDDFADALAAAPYAYRRTMPILLVKTNSVPGATDEVLRELRGAGAADAIVAGGTSAVCEETESYLDGLGYSVARASGANRYATAAALVRHAVDAGWVTPESVGVSTGEDFPDALGGGVAIGANGGVIVLTKSSYLRSEAEQVLCDCTEDLSAVHIFGGESAVSPAVLEQIRAIWDLP